MKILRGRILRAKLYNRALTQAEVEKLYRRERRWIAWHIAWYNLTSLLKMLAGRLLCMVGRHDWEVHQHRTGWARLTCRRCRRRSYRY